MGSSLIKSRVITGTGPLKFFGLNPVQVFSLKKKEGLKFLRGPNSFLKKKGKNPFLFLAELFF